MNVIYGRNHKVPRVIDVESLAKLAVITDYPQCHEAMAVICDVWMDVVKSFLTHDTYCRELILWIMILHVFHDKDAFSSAIRTAILKSGEEMQSLGLPIHEDIISGREDQRQDLLDQVLSSLSSTPSAVFAQDSVSPSVECDAMLLGSQIKQMKAVDVL